MDPFLGVFLGLLLGVVNVVGQAANNNRNITAQEKANEKNEALMRESWEKESIVNKAKEYEEAGFSPLLATGVSSNYTPIQVQPTKSNFDISSVLGSVSEGFNQTMLYKQMKQAEDSAKLDNEYKREQINLLKTQIEHYGESPELKNLEYVWGKLEEHWPHVADQISSWLGKDKEFSFDELYNTGREQNEEIHRTLELSKMGGSNGHPSFASFEIQQTVEGLIKGFIKNNGSVPKQVLSRFVDPIAETFNLDVVDLINLYYDLLDE